MVESGDPDAQEAFEVPLRGKGHHLLSAALKNEGDLRVAGGPVHPPTL
jgi:hypothetical protein